MNTDKISFSMLSSYVTISFEKNQLEIIITNNSDDKIKFENSNKVKIEDYPAWGEECGRRDPPGFEFRFSYGEKSADMDTPDACKNIKVSMQQSKESWSIMPKDYNKKIDDKKKPEPYWQIIPSEEVTLESKDSLFLQLDHIPVNDKRGSTQMTITFKAPDIMETETIDIMKLAQPKIINFKADQDKYEAGDDVRFSWTLQDFYGTEAEITLDNRDVKGDSCTLKNVTSESHTLQVKNKAGYVDFSETDISFEIGADLNVTDCGSGTITLEWNTKSMKDITLNGDKVDKNGKKDMPVEGDKDFVLSMTNIKTGEECTREINFLMPVIQEFSAKAVDNIYTINMGQDEEDFLSGEEVRDETAPVVMIQPYEPPTPPRPSKRNVSCSWKTKNVNHCSIPQGSYESDEASMSNVSISVSKDCDAVKLLATGNYGYQVSKEAKLT